ncbi:hypothetical protein JHL17_11265 [Azospirillum sp. YIM B02556]|uniref:Helix-turn-helix domain-containing protein n=1 Tax=Azospirillum endophyticum TaxID=2800326 RepID=A0ABS1F3X4_9PROT|nr:hypothetical protein [Azospirillum endophyticum]MBK1837992.1 hypothetical protein [Azospirillum endophyticum]
MLKDSPSRRVIGKFGGVSELSRALGHKNPTTVRGWYERGFIPARQQQTVLIIGKEMGVDISPADFFDLPRSESSQKIKNARPVQRSGIS